MDDKPIAGIIHCAKPVGAKRSARWLPLMSVPDPARAAEQAAASGGKVLVPAKRLPGGGEVSVLADPEGGLFGVIHAVDSWLWVGLWAKDAPRMADFYRPIGGYTVTRQEGPGDRPELRLLAAGYPRAGVLEYRRKDLPSTWVPYVRVKDLQETVARIRRAGGRAVVKPSQEIREGRR